LQVAIDNVFARVEGAVVPERRSRGFTYETTLKRVIDILLATLALIISLPIWVGVMIAIKAESRGPVIFMQERVGLHGRPFRFYKFRSMYDGSDALKAQLSHLNEVDGPVFKLRRDPRVTRVGRLLRRTSLDELPQLINVIIGDMSLVGPRPAVPAEVERYELPDLVRLTVKPGITCWWQVRGRSSCGFQAWMDYDREYVSGLSLWVDIHILARTVWAVASCRGAY
jgi:lipopolysaccharide/colanic/teichoic acid biosynthesis glycosyltransferase